jgi:hypothetical protein
MALLEDVTLSSVVSTRLIGVGLVIAGAAGGRDSPWPLLDHGLRPGTLMNAEVEFLGVR